MGDLRLLLPAVAAWITAWCAIGASDVGIAPPAVAASLWAAAAACLVVLMAVRRPRGIPTIAATALVVLAAAGLAATSAAVQLEQRSESPLAAIAAAHDQVAIVIEVVAAPRPMPSRWGGAGGAPSLRVDARLIAVDGRTVAPVPVTTTLELPERDLSLGVRLAFTARPSALPGAEQSAYRLRPEGEVAIVAPPPLWLGWAVVPRAELADAATRLGGDGAALVPGLAIGDTTGVGTELDDAMRASSLSHLTAVSGANCAIVTAAAFGLAALCGAPRSVRVLAALAALVGFVVLVTPQPSVVRAGAMAVAVLVAIASGRSGGGAAALSVAVIGLLAFDPWLARDYGFALSAAATAGLILLAAPLAARLARVMPLPIAAALAVPLAAQLACQPILVLLDPSIALYGVAANLLAAPAAPIGTVVGLVACFVLPILPAVGFLLLQVAWVPASWIALVAHGASTLPGGRLPWPADAPGALLLAGCTGLALLIVFARGARTRIRAAAALAVALAVPVGMAIGGPLVVGATRPGDWDLAACDVGQGDAMLIRAGGATALVDAGPDPGALARCLTLLGVDRVDLLVLTHWDADHVGGTAAVAGRVGTVLHGPLDGDRSDRVLEPLRDAGATAVEVVAGDRGRLGDATWKVAWPKPGAAPGNDASVVLDLEASGFRAVFLGDLGEEAQARLMRSTDLGRADVVKVAHHGSADQSERLYDELGATVGLIGVGADNGYGHPTARLLEVLATARTTVVRTDRSGTCTLTGGDGAFDLWCERRDSGSRPYT